MSRALAEERLLLAPGLWTNCDALRGSRRKSSPYHIKHAPAKETQERERDPHTEQFNQLWQVNGNTVCKMFL